MNGSDLAADLQDEHETAFSRLGSSKAMYAVTGGEMDGDRIRAAAATDALALAEVLESWTESGDGGEADLFADLAADALDRAADVADDPEIGEKPNLYDALAAFETTPARLGGLLGRSLVALEHAGQMVGFFVGDADPMAADDFRGYRSDLEAERDRVIEALDATCEGDDNWAAAEDAADAVVEAAYDDYVETLESMGIKPKNVC
ncbi:transcription antitermination protein [Halobellus salinisoli]|uniref:transcription antitermination protein n=1 Tax=Halobellus salinisoli TaxID=3108500 RepID=UPI00300B00D8